MKKGLIVSLFLWITYECHSQNWQDTIAQIEKIMERYKPEDPGCQLAISRYGQIIFSKAYGMADLEHNVFMTTESPTEAGSVSKQFTAAAILLLEQQGKLSLDDDVRKYIPELPDYGTSITLRQIMHHSSGIKDWGSISAVAGWPRTTRVYSNEDVLYIVTRQKTLNHAPGEMYSYSNSNYNLLAIIVERVTGKSLAEFCRTSIFEPAGMKHTEWRSNHQKVLRNRVIAYERQRGVYYTSMPNENAYGPGGLITTAEDLIAWNNFYLTGKFGNPSLLNKQLSTGKLNNGRQGRYGAGLFIDSARGWSLITHSGATAGYRANLEYFPDLGLSIAFLSNAGDPEQGPPTEIAIRNLLVRDLSVRPQQQRMNFTPVDVPMEKLISYTGWYKEKGNLNAVKLFIRDGKLANSRGGNFTAISENTFILGQGPNTVEVYPGKKGKMFLISPIDTVTFYAIDSVKNDSISLKEYFGKYYSEEAEATTSVYVKNGKLVISQPARNENVLTGTYKDSFTYQHGWIIEFLRNRKGRIIGYNISVNRARNIRFDKQLE